MMIEMAQEAPDVVFDMCLVNSIPASVLFDSRVSHSFITHCFVKEHNIPKCPMKKHMLVDSPCGDMQATLMCPSVRVEIKGVEFLANPIVLKSSSIDVILGIDWLNPRKAVIQGENGTVHLISKSGEEVICQATTKTKEVCSVNQMEGATIDKTKVVNEFLDVFPDDLPDMPPDRDIEFIIELLPRTAPIAKRPYRMGVNELEELKK